MFTQKLITCGSRMSSCTKLLKALYSKSVQHEVKELEIPVPWGKVAGKLWGSQDKQPILAMHGWQDNAASFDNIAPFIVNKTPVLAIDLPGHGLSSWLPPGFMYTELVYFLLIKRLKRYFGWDKIKVIAHSLSSMTVYWYAASFPKEMQYVIALDEFKFQAIHAKVHATYFGSAVDALFKLEESKKPQPRYKTQSEIIKKAAESFIQMDEESYKILMTRGITQKEDGTYIINRDPRLRAMPIHNMFSLDELEEYADIIKCPYLIIKGDDNFYGDNRENFYKVLEILKAANGKVEFNSIQATHHLHLTHAESTAAIIMPFLEKYD